MFKDLSLESRNKQTQNRAPIQCANWPRNVTFGSKLNRYEFQKSKT